MLRCAFCGNETLPKRVTEGYAIPYDDENKYVIVDLIVSVCCEADVLMPDGCIMKPIVEEFNQKVYT